MKNIENLNYLDLLNKESMIEERKEFTRLLKLYPIEIVCLQKS